jgi:hypothetical protein
MRLRHGWWRSPRLCGPLLAVTALAVFAQPAAALSPGGNGTDVTCAAGPASVTTQFTNPTQISGTGQLQCPAPGNNSSGGFGATGPGPGTSFPPPALGTPCHIVEQLPVQFRYPGFGPQYLHTMPFNLIEKFASGQVTTLPWAGANFSTTNNPGMPYISGDQWYYSAGFGTWYETWRYDGTWQKEPDGTTGCSGTTGWNSRCAGRSLFVQCFDFVAQTVAAPGPLPVAALGFDLTAFLKGQVFGGTILSVPDNPRPGLTNLATCYYVRGMTIDGQPANPNQDVFWEKIVPGPPVDGEGHQVYFVFVIHVFYRQTDWDFGDGTTATFQRGSAALDPNCPGPDATEQFAASHVYTRYSTGDGFHITVTHHYGVDVSEIWTDTNAQTNHADFPNAIPDLTVPANPLPFYAKQVVQEEGVPVG